MSKQQKQEEEQRYPEYGYMEGGAAGVLETRPIASITFHCSVCQRAETFPLIEEEESPREKDWQFLLNSQTGLLEGFCPQCRISEAR